MVTVILTPDVEDQQFYSHSTHMLKKCKGMKTWAIMRAHGGQNANFEPPSKIKSWYANASVQVITQVKQSEFESGM